MALDTSIPLQAKPAEIASPLQSLGGLMQLRGQMADLALRNQQIESQKALQAEHQANVELKQRAEADEKTFGRTLSENGGNWDSTFKSLEAGGHVSPTFVLGKREMYSKAVKERSLADEQEIKTGNEKLKKLGAGIAGIESLPGDQRPAEYQQFRQRALADPLTASDAAAHLPASWSNDEAKRLKWLGESAIQINDAALKLKGDERAALAAADIHAEQAAQLPGVVADASAKVAEAPVRGAIAAATLADPDKLTPQQRVDQKDRDKTHQEAAQRLGIERARLFQDKEETKLTDQARDKMAEMFATTGQMPTLGQGKNAAQMRSVIINRAADLYPDVQFATNGAVFQANKASLGAIQKQFDAVNAFEETAGKNLDTFLKTAGKVVDTGSPWINKPLRAIDSKLLGSADQAAFNAARQTAVTEIGKVLSSASGNGVLSDSAREEVQHLIGPDATMKQIVAAARILKQDMGNRKESYQDQIGAIRKRISGKPEGEAKPVASYKQTATGANGHKIGSNDGETWYDVQTGAKL